MSQNYYDLYIESVLELAETIVIKSEYSALRLNEYLLAYVGPTAYVEHDKRTWKYYLNVAGEYHFTDTPMMVTSLDTLQPIVFNKANLAIHTATAKAYKYNSRFYRELVTTYPNQEQLILGILYPADLEHAISAPDLSVLAYPGHLVEDNEMSLIDNINIWLDHYNIRWNNKQFTLSDSLYGAAMLGIMHLSMVPLIINLRLKACKTSEAHSYHVREYLASHGMLDVYLGQMTKKQALFFYRNINYIERNSGKQDTFFWLVEKIMTDRGLPLSEYTMKHDVSVLPEQNTPRVTFRKRLLNDSVATNDRTDNFHTLSSVLDKEEPLAPGNREFRVFNEQKILSTFEASMSSVVTTKVLESSLIDYTDAVPYTMHSVLLNHWIYWSQTDKFNAYVRIRNPKNGELFSINTKDAYLYFIYGFCASLGIKLSTVPMLNVERVQRDPMPNNDDLMSVADFSYIPEEYATFIRSLQPTTEVITSLSGFKAKCEAVHDAVMKQTAFISNQEHQYTRGLVHAMVSRMYADIVLPSPYPGMVFTDWLNANNYPFENFTELEWVDVYKNVYEEVTGYKMSVTENVSSLQRAMVSLMEQLSSYSIQFVSDVNKAAVQIMNWAAIRVGDFKSAGLAYFRIHDTFVHVYKGIVHSYDRGTVEIADFIKNYVIDNGIQYFGLHEMPIEFTRDKTYFNRRNFMDLGSMIIDNSYLPEFNTANGYSNLPLFSGYNSLTQEQRSELKSIYPKCINPIIVPDKVDITDIMLTDELPGLTYLHHRRRNVNAFNYFYVPNYTYHFITGTTEVELDAFYPNFEPVDVGAITLNTGNTLVEGIKYVFDVPLDNEYSNMTYSGGWSYLDKFDPSVKTDTEYEMSGLGTIYGLFSPTFYPVFRSFDFNIFNTMHNASAGLELDSFYARHEFNISNYIATRDLGGLVSTANSFTYETIMTTDSIWLDTFYEFYDTRTAPDLEQVMGHHEASGIESSTDAKSFDFKLTYTERSIESFAQVFRQARSLDDMNVVIEYKNLSVFNSVTTVRGLPNFRLIMRSRSLDIFNWLLGMGGTNLPTNNTYHNQSLDAIYNTTVGIDVNTGSSYTQFDLTDFFNLFAGTTGEGTLNFTQSQDIREIELVI